MSASSKVFSNSTLMGCISSFLPLTDLSNVCRTNSSLCAHTKTKAAAEQTFGYMLRTVNNPDMAAFGRFSTKRLNNDQSPLALVRQMPCIRHLKITNPVGRFFLIGLNNIKGSNSINHTYGLLSLDIAFLGGEDIDFRMLTQYPKLQKLRINSSEIDDTTAIDDTIVDILVHIPSLTELGLLNVSTVKKSSSSIYGGQPLPFGPSGIERLLQKLPNLRSLTLGYPAHHNSTLHDPRAGAAAAIAACGQNLVTIGLHRNMDAPLDIVKMIDACPRLTLLDVTESKFATRWTARSRDKHDIIWYEVLEKLAKDRPALQIKGPPKD